MPDDEILHLRELAAQQSLMMDTVPIQMWLLSDSDTCGRANRPHADFFGMTKEALESKKLDEFLDREIAEACRKLNREVFERKEAISSEEWLPDANGDLRLIQITRIPYFDSTGDIAHVICFGIDITEQRRGEEACRRREALLDAAARSGQMLLGASAPETVLERVIGLIGETSGQDRAYYFERHAAPESEEKVVSLRHEWVRSGIAPRRHNPRLQALPFEQVAPYAHERLRQGLDVCAPVRKLPPGEREILEAPGIVSILLVPVLAEGAFHGFIGFDNCRTENAWSRGERSALAAVASGIGSALTRWQAETALRRERQRLVSIIEGTNVGTWEWNVQTGAAVFNPRWAEMLGYTLEEISPVSIDTWIRFAHPEDLKTSNDLLARHFSGERGHYACEVRMRHKRGHWIWVLDRGKVSTWTEDGKPLLMQGTHLDISQRKTYEEALRQSEKRYRDLFENVSDFLYFHDLEGNFIESNFAFKEAHGYDLEDSSKINARDLMPEADRPKFDDYLVRIRENEKDEGSFRLVKRDGGLIIVEYKNSLVKNSAGQPIGVRGSARDITAKVNAEEERTQLEARLRQAQKVEAVGRMAGAVAHHYNNLLSVVMGNLYLALQDLPEHCEPARKLTNAMHAAQRAAKLGAMMLASLGQAIGRRELLDLCQTCRDAVAALAVHNPDHVTLNADFPDPGPVIRANPDQIRQVFGNLLSNAWESVGEQPGTVSVSIRTASSAQIPRVHRWPVEFQPQSADFACLEVADEGCGIAAEDIEKLFDPFYSTKFIGRGLGLSVALGTIKAHDGCITVHSRPGRGSLFRVFLPLSAESASVPKPVSRPAKQAPRAGRRGDSDRG